MSAHDQIKEAALKLVALLEEPEYGIHSWDEAVRRACDEIAEYAPSYRRIDDDTDCPASERGGWKDGAK